MECYSKTTSPTKIFFIPLLVFNFIALAEKCEFIKKNNIYFAQNREYWFGGGAIIDNAQIRIFELYDKTPWRDSDLGITPDMEYAKQWCKFYKKN